MKRRDLFLIIYLVVQVALPLHYYLVRQNHPLKVYDERFAWRMFSPERMVKCQVAFFRGTREVRLPQEFHSTWISLARRGRPDVVDHMADTLCKKGGPITLEMSCKEAEGHTVTLEDRSRDLCQGGLL